jgi:hypothetical protein
MMEDTRPRIAVVNKVDAPGSRVRDVEKVSCHLCNVALAWSFFISEWDEVSISELSHVERFHFGDDCHNMKSIRVPKGDHCMTQEIEWKKHGKEFPLQ